MRGQSRTPQRAPRWGALFAWGCTVLAIALGPSAGRGANHPPAHCAAPERLDARGRVVYVYDGDTVKLADGRRVRLIGVDTPEMNHDSGRAQAGARAARQALSGLLARHDHRVALRYGRERRDDYGRMLAHAYVDGTSVTAWLLRRGHGAALTVPPNVGNLRCYRASERQARAARRGVWRLPRYRPVPVHELQAKARGFHIIRGEVERIGRSRRAVWVDFGPAALRIDRADLRYFRRLDPRELRGRRIEARGWLYRAGGELRMAVRHPAAIEILR